VIPTYNQDGHQAKNVKLSTAVQPSWSEAGPPNAILEKDHSMTIWFQFSNWFPTRRFLWEFSIGSYVKLSSAVVAILVGVLKCQTQFWKRTAQGSSQQSLVEIGSVGSEEKIFF
jgi:hypothetical protein